MIRRMLHLGVNELRLTWKDRTSAVWMVIMPVAMILFFGMVGSGGGQEPGDVTIRLTVVDRDVSWLSRALVDTLKAESFDVTEVDETEAAALDNRVRTLVIPEGFNDAVARREQVTLFLVTQPGSNDQAGAVAELHVHRALVQLVGTLIDMQQIAGEAEPLDLQGDRLREFRGLAGREPLVRVESGYTGAGRAVPSGFGQSIPGMTTMFMVMAVLIGGGMSITEEKQNGVLRRLATAPFTPRTLIAGKLTGLLMVGLIQAAILFGTGFALSAFNLFGADFYMGSSPLALALLVVTASASFAAIGLFYGAILSTPAQASSVGWLSGMIMASLGGCWWPLELVPAWLRQVGHIFPTAWMMDGLHDLTSFGRGLDAVLPEVAALGAFGLVFGLLGARLLKVRG